MSNLLNGDAVQAYKPFRYPEAYDKFIQHQSAHWTKDEIVMGEDVKDWHKLSEKEQEFIKAIFLLFTQNDVQVGSGYDVMLRLFKPTEVQMMLRNQADRENIHIDAYSYLLDTLGFDDNIYSEFKGIPVLAEKLQYVEEAKVKKYEDYHADILDDLTISVFEVTQEDIDAEIDYRFRRDVAYMLAVYAGLVEGVSLFAQFAMLLNYQRFNLMPGMCQVVTWSIRDEEMHVQNNSWLFTKFIEENDDIWTDDLKSKIYEAARQIVSQEKKYIDYVFEQGITKGITKEDMYMYVEYIADRRLVGLNLKPNWNREANPFPWMEELLNSPEFGNFFETRVTEYSKGVTQGTWEEVRASL